jgi:hypothetical protein
MMAEIIAFQNSRNGSRKSPSGPAEILFFTGVRVEYHAPDDAKAEAAAAQQTGRKRRTTRKAVSN